MDHEERLKAALADRYQIEREIGSGGMATVYLAEDLKHHRQVAVKVLEPDLAVSLGAERFLREIETAANLTHPHILPVFDSGETEGFLFYVMPFVKGESLRSRLTKEKQLPVEDAVQITREIADALAYAHEEGVIHRDVKPANILLEAGHAVLADFGVAHAVAEAKEERLTRTGTSLGTPAYMSPEQATGERELDGRADQYALGCVLYEMLAGHPPFTGIQVEALVRQHLTEEPPSVTGARPSVPKEVAKVIQRALAKSPADRFRTTGEMGAAFALTTAPIRPASGRGRTKAVIYAGTVILGLATIAAIASLWPSDATEDWLRLAVIPFENRTGDPALDVLGPMVSDRIVEGVPGSELIGDVFDVIPSRQVRSAMSAHLQAAQDPLLALVEATGAGTVVSGWYYLEGEFLLFQAEITLTDEGRVTVSVRERGTLSDQGSAVESISDRVMGALFSHMFIQWGREPYYGNHVKHSAMLASRQGDGLFGEDYRAAIAHFDRAVELDSTFAWPRLRTAIAYQNLGERAEADSVLDLLEQRREDLSEVNRLWLDLRRAQVRNDIMAELDISRRLMEVEPGEPMHRYNAGNNARRANRLDEAIELLTPLTELPDGYWSGLWNTLTSAHHMSGNHEEEFRLAKRGREFFPTSFGRLRDEIDAMAALGRIEDVNRLVDESLTFSEGSPGTLMRIIATELRAHGYPDEAKRLLDRALRWYENRPPREADSEAHRFNLARVHYAAGRWEDAQSFMVELAAADPENIAYLGYLGVLAARLGDRAEARRVGDHLSEIDDPFLGGVNTYWRAGIAAVLGDRDRAVGLLREAHSEGYSFGIDWHRSVVLEPLRDFAPFVEFMKPRG